MMYNIIKKNSKFAPVGCEMQGDWQAVSRWMSENTTFSESTLTNQGKETDLYGKPYSYEVISLNEDTGMRMYQVDEPAFGASTTIRVWYYRGLVYKISQYRDSRESSNYSWDQPLTRAVMTALVGLGVEDAEHQILSVFDDEDFEYRSPYVIRC